MLRLPALAIDQIINLLEEPLPSTGELQCLLGEMQRGYLLRIACWQMLTKGGWWLCANSLQWLRSDRTRRRWLLRSESSFNQVRANGGQLQNLRAASVLNYTD